MGLFVMKMLSGRMGRLFVCRRCELIDRKAENSFSDSERSRDII